MSINQSNNQPNAIPVLHEKEVLAELAKPFEDHEIEWKIQNVIQNNYGKTQYQGLGLGYIDARAIQRRLNEVCGLAWSTKYNHYMLGNYGVVECTIGIFVNGQWIYRTDGVELEQGGIEPVKSAFSNALKRAAVHFGIGHFLYSIGTVYIDIFQNNVPGEKNQCPQDADKKVGGNFKVSGKQVQIHGKYVTPKYSDILRKQEYKKKKGKNNPNQQNQQSQNQKQPQNNHPNPQHSQSPSNTPQHSGQHQGQQPRYQQHTPQNNNGPTEQEYRQMVKSIYDCINSLKIAPNNVKSLYQFVQSQVYESVETTPYQVLQALYGMMNPIKIFLEIGQSTFKLNEQQLFSYASKLLKEPVGKVSNLFHKLNSDGVNMIFEMIRQDTLSSNRRQA